MNGCNASIQTLLGKRSQQNKRGKRSEPVRNVNIVLLHQSGSSVVARTDFSLNYVTAFEIIVHSQQGNPPDAAQTHDVAVAESATANEASVPASTSTHSVQHEQTVHLILLNLIFQLLLFIFLILGTEVMNTHIELDTSCDDSRNLLLVLAEIEQVTQGILKMLLIVSNS
jgi:hypothetical protein